MDRLKASWRLMLAALKVLRKTPGLCILPTASGLMMAMLVAALAGGGAALIAWKVAEPGWTLLALMLGPALVVYVACSFVAILFNAALVACVLGELEGQPVSLGDGLRLAWARRGAIFSWALLYPAAGAVVSLLKQRAGSGRGAGRLLAGLLVRAPGAAWSLATFLIVPVIVFEDLPSTRARLKRSFELLERTWGEQLVGRFGAGIGVAVVTLAGILLVGATGVGLRVTLLNAHAVAASVVLLGAIAALGAAGVLLAKALNGVCAAVLYSYAVTGMLPEEFSPDLLPRPHAA